MTHSPIIFNNQFKSVVLTQVPKYERKLIKTFNIWILSLLLKILFWSEFILEGVLLCLLDDSSKKSFVVIPVWIELHVKDISKTIVDTRTLHTKLQTYEFYFRYWGALNFGAASSYSTKITIERLCLIF